MNSSSVNRARRTYTVLAGGVGAARLLRGLHSLVDPRSLNVVVNTGDDEEFYGLHVSPDIDTVLYTLAGIAPIKRGWGIAGDSFHCLGALETYFGPAWFRLGDRDLATHVFRTLRLRQGFTLTEVTLAQARALGVRTRVLPMSDQRVRTWVRTRESGWLPFQRYLVRHSAHETVCGIRFRGIRTAHATPAVIEAIERADWVLLPPSNPLVSFGPILALPGIRSLLRRKRQRVIAVSPFVAGKPVKGPLHKMLSGLGYAVSVRSVAEILRPYVRYFILDRRDAAEAERIATLGMTPVIADTLMTTTRRSRNLSAFLLRLTES